MLSVGLLLVSLLAVVLLAKKFSLVVDAVAAIGAPAAFAGVLVALLILLPESVAPVRRRAAMICNSIDTGAGSSLATIGLTIPAVAVAAYTLEKTLVLGLDHRDIVLLVLTFILSMLTFGARRADGPLRLDGVRCCC